MTERTYTETEMLAIRAATLREAAAKIKRTLKEDTIGYAEGWNDGIDLAEQTTLALIDQPADTALNALIGAAYEANAAVCADAFAEHMTAAIMGDQEAARNRESAAAMAEKLLHAIRHTTPADALAALEAVKLAERERLASMFDHKHEQWAVAMGRNPADYTSQWSQAAAAIRGASE